MNQHEAIVLQKNQEAIIRTLTSIFIAAFLLPIGCSETTQPVRSEEPKESVASDKNAPKTAVDSRKTDEAYRVVDQAIEALGGPDALELLSQGYVKFEIEGFAGIAQEFGADKLTFEAYFDLPHLERRDIYSKLDGKHMIIISNSGTLWVGDQNGVGFSRPAPPQEVYRGPFLVGILQGVIELKEDSYKLILKERDAEDSLLVIEAYENNDITSRIFFDKSSHLPVRIEKMLSGLQIDTFHETLETATTLSDYKMFGSATLPTRVVMDQGGTNQINVKLISADFDSPVAKKHFVIPK